MFSQQYGTEVYGTSWSTYLKRMIAIGGILGTGYVIYNNVDVIRDIMKGSPKKSASEDEIHLALEKAYHQFYLTFHELSQMVQRVNKNMDPSQLAQISKDEIVSLLMSQGIADRLERIQSKIAQDCNMSTDALEKLCNTDSTYAYFNDRVDKLYDGARQGVLLVLDGEIPAPIVSEYTTPFILEKTVLLHKRKLELFGKVLSEFWNSDEGANYKPGTSTPTNLTKGLATAAESADREILGEGENGRLYYQHFLNYFSLTNEEFRNEFEELDKKQQKDIFNMMKGSKEASKVSELD